MSTEGRLICCRCQQPIQRGEDYQEVAKFSDSAAGATLVIHTAPCKSSR